MQQYTPHNISPEQDKITASVCYRYSFSLNGAIEALPQEEKYACILNNLQNQYDVLGESDTDAEADPFFRDIKITRDFLHGGKLPFACERLLLRSVAPELIKFSIKPTACHMAIFPEFNAAQLSFCFLATDINTDQLIYLRHIHGGAPAFQNQSGETSLDDLLQQITTAAGFTAGDIERTYTAEIRSFLDYEDVEELLAAEARRIYGIMTGDEGWQFVPQALAESRLENAWGSREFTRFITFGNNSIFFNLRGCPASEAYIVRQHDFGGRTYGGINPYFLVDSDITGLNHGTMYAQELVLVIKTIADRILHHKDNFTTKGNFRLRDDIRRTKHFRSELISTLNRVENLGISEVGELEQMLLQSYRITPLIENIKYLLELLESDLDLLYQQSTNRLVNILTVAGLLLTVIGLLM